MLTTRCTERRRGERGVALMAAIVMLVLAGLIVAGVMMAIMSTMDRGRDASDTTLGTGAAEDGVRAYLAALNADIVGEHTGFAFPAAALVETVRETSPTAGMCTSPTTKLCLVKNSDTAFPYVDARLVKPADQLTVRRFVKTGEYRFWQIMAVSAPQYGRVEAGKTTSPGGAARVYVRGWQGPANRTVANSVKPVVVRAEVRPNSFSDYQVLTDGKLLISDGFTVNGRIHTNGLNQSFFDQYASYPASITVAGTAVCNATARLSTSAGAISTTGGTCHDNSKKFDNTRENYSLLRTVSAANLVRSRCAQNQPVVVRCINAPASFKGPYQVRLSGTSIQIQTPGFAQTISAVNNRIIFPTNADPTRSFGAAIIFDRSVEVRGSLGANARATIFAMNDTAQALAEVPSIWIKSAGTVGTNGSSTTSVGFVAEGDVVADEAAACPLQLNAAVMAQGGMLSMNPRYRGAVMPGAPTCGGAARIRGSIVGHFPPYLRIGTTNGYTGTRTYDYDPNLYHNPPPYFPTATTWRLLTSTDADSTCFTGTPTAPLLRDSNGCR